jgi:hypothetical protein
MRGTNRLHRSVIPLRRGFSRGEPHQAVPARLIDIHARPQPVQLRGELMPASCRYCFADVLRAHCLMTDRKILGSKYCAAVRGFSILVTRV